MHTATSLWSDLVRDNPLVAREAGLGRGLWRSPFAWACAVAAVVTTVTILGEFTRLMFTLSQANAFTLASWENAEAWGRIQQIAIRLELVLWLLQGGVFGWIIARAWTRDRDQASREQISVSPLRARHLIVSKSLLFVVPLVICSALEMSARFGVRLGEFFLEPFPGSRRERMFGLAPEEMPELLRQLIGAHLLESLMWATGIVVSFMIVGFATRLALAWPYPVIGAIAVPALCYLIYFGASWGVAWVAANLWLPVLDRWAIGIYLGSFWLVAALVWWRLPRRVAQVYGPCH
jgi:hypothetical protein